LYLRGISQRKQHRLTDLGSTVCWVGFALTALAHHQLSEAFSIPTEWPPDLRFWQTTHGWIWFLWTVGAIAIVASWLRIVSSPIGWLGLCTAMTGVLASWPGREQTQQLIIVGGVAIVTLLGFWLLRRGALRRPARPRDTLNGLMYRNSLLAGIALIVFAGWAGYEQRTNPEKRDDKHMWCYSALACAEYIKQSFEADLHAGSTTFSAVRSKGSVVTVEYDVGFVRSDFPTGRVENGRTLERWADDFAKELRNEACKKLDHRDFIQMGGMVIHRHRFSDGEVLKDVVIDRCA
jgi:hypothetical protein